MAVADEAIERRWSFDFGSSGEVLYIGVVWTLRGIHICELLYQVKESDGRRRSQTGVVL